MRHDPLAISNLIRHRRSFKPTEMDSSRPVPRHVLEELLEDANWAPTHGLTEPWRFFIFTGESRHRLGELLETVYRQITPPAEFKLAKAEKLRTNPTLAPVVIAIGMKRQSSGKISELDEIAAVACAVQNLHLSATAHGLGGFWSSAAATTSPALQQYVGLDPADRLLGLFYIGYPSRDWPNGQRTPVADKLRWMER